MLSEDDWGAHDSNIFLFLVNIDYDAKPNESSIQGLWGELQHRTSAIPLIGLQTDSLATGQTGDDIVNSTPISPDLDDPEQLTGESIQSFLTLVVQLQGIVALGRLVIHAHDTIYIKTQIFRLLRYYSPAPRNIARSDWATQNITHNMTSSIIQPYGLHSL